MSRLTTDGDIAADEIVLKEHLALTPRDAMPCHLPACVTRGHEGRRFHRIEIGSK